MQPDLTLLTIVFSVNMGFSAIDSLAGNLLESLRRRTDRRMGKYRDAKWIRRIAPTDTAKDEAKRDLLVKVVKKVLLYAKHADDLFRTNVFVWKIIMAAAAATSFVFIAIPFAPWWTALLILPVPFCFVSCLIELLVFNKRLGKKCDEVEIVYGNLQDDNDIPSNVADRESVETKLAAQESLFNN